MALSAPLSPTRFADLPGWERDDHAAAYAAFRRSALRVLEKPYRTGSLGIACEAFADAHEEVLAAGIASDSAARHFFERHFVPCHVAPDQGRNYGFVTGFYEPVVAASPVRSAQFRYPLYARPDDLVDIDDANRPPGLDPYLAFGRRNGDTIEEYFDRAAIERGALDGRGFETAWLADKVDLFFVHVQGAARLNMTDGRVRRVTYAAKSGQRFTGPGGVLAGLGEIPRSEVTMQSIREWFRRNPDRIDEILWRNRSFIFFREAPVDDPRLGPVAAAKVPLTAGRSMAVDRLLHTFGTPIYVDSPTLLAFEGSPFRRLMVAQDTGSAILGAARGDLFAGSGDAAGEIAGVIKHDADFYALVPKPLLGAGG